MSRTQADLDANVSAGKFLSAKLNDDGSVTYKMTKGQHKEVMEGIRQPVLSSTAVVMATILTTFLSMMGKYRKTDSWKTALLSTTRISESA